ncbi:MAG: recombination mediator RecR, partial [Patescibacteria group bacterium]
MKIAKPLLRLIESFNKLPGIGPKTAQRLAYYLLHVPQIELEVFADNLSSLKKDTVLCSVCKNVSENDPCDICNDSSRDKTTVMVLEHPLELISFENTGRFKGIYHILHGAINPLENIGPDEIFVEDLLKRVKKEKIAEIIIATNPTM